MHHIRMNTCMRITFSEDDEHTTTHCNTLQHIATRCNTQCVTHPRIRITFLVDDVQIAALQGLLLILICIYEFHTDLYVYACYVPDERCENFRIAAVANLRWLVAGSVRDMTHSYIWHDSLKHSYVWHDSFIFVTRFIDGQDVTHSRVWHDVCDMTHWYVWHDLFILVTWLTSGSDWLRVLCVTSLIDVCNLTHSCVSPDAFMCVTWLIYMCNMIYVRADWLRVLCLRCLIHICDVNGVCLCSVRVSSHSWPHSSHMCDRTERCAWHDSFICVRVVSISWHDEMCDMDHSYSCVTWIVDMWHDSFICSMTD